MMTVIGFPIASCSKLPPFSKEDVLKKLPSQRMTIIILISEDMEDDDIFCDSTN